MWIIVDEKTNKYNKKLFSISVINAQYVLTMSSKSKSLLPINFMRTCYAYDLSKNQLSSTQTVEHLYFTST